MRLGELLGPLEDEQIVALGRVIVPAWDDVPRQLLAHSLESVLRESGQVEQTIQARRPPVMALLRELLEASGNRVRRSEIEARVATVGDEWMAKVSAGYFVGRGDSCRIYRRLLMAAWQHDLQLDPSETALLGFLRQELGITSAEHFLIAYHPDVQPFWRRSNPFDVVLGALTARGVVFTVGDDLVLPEEFVPRVRRTLGIFMHRESARRLLDHLSNADLKNALDVHHLKTSGAKPDRAERLIEHLTPAPGILDVVNVRDLRSIARKTGVHISGSKDDLVWSLIEHFEVGGDLNAQQDESDIVEVEPNEIAEADFRTLFSPLKGRVLLSICERHGLRISGSKEARIQTLWNSPLSERSLLRSLKNPELKELCEKHGLDHRGPKDERIERLISHHSVLRESNSRLGGMRRFS